MSIFGCPTRIVQIGGVSGSTSGPYTVAIDTPTDGVITVTDGASGQTIVLTLYYKLDFVIADWVVGGSDSTITITSATHEVGNNPKVVVYEGNELVQVDTTTVDNSGNVVISVPNGLTFDGKVVISY